MLLDLRTPRLDGAHVTRQILLDCPDAAVVVLAAFDGDHLMFDFLCAGARAYLRKISTRVKFLTRSHAVARGQSRLTPCLTRKLIDEFRRLCLAARCGDAPYCNPEEPLTDRENDILKLIVAGKGNKEIAGTLKLSRRHGQELRQPHTGKAERAQPHRTGGQGAETPPRLNGVPEIPNVRDGHAAPIRDAGPRPCGARQERGLFRRRTEISDRSDWPWRRAPTSPNASGLLGSASVITGRSG